MQPNNVTGYIDYFRQLAVSHKDIRHDPATEHGNGKKKFAIFGANEIIQGIQTQIGFPCLAMELYDNKLNNETIYDIRQNPKGSFMVIDHAKELDFSDMLRAYATCEGIINDLMKKIWQDHYGVGKERCTTPFKQFRFDAEIIPTGKVFTNEYGYYVTFGFDFQNTINITQPPADGTFL